VFDAERKPNRATMEPNDAEHVGEVEALLSEVEGALKTYPTD